MKKYQLFPVLDNSSKVLYQLSALHRVMKTALQHGEVSNDDLDACMSLCCDLDVTLSADHNHIAGGVAELNILNNAVNG